MAGNTLITRLKADTSQFDSKVKGAKSTLQQFGMGGKEAGSMIGQLDRIMGTNIGTFGKLSVAVGAASAALKVTKDAFNSCEDSIDEWGRTTKSAEAAYKTMLTSLNTGNWDGFFERLNEAIGGAAELYNLFDRLGSMKVNNGPLVATLENQLAQLRLMKQAGKDVEQQVKDVQAKLNAIKGQEIAQGKAANIKGIIDTLKARGVSEKDARTFVADLQKRGQRAFDDAKTERGLAAGDMLNNQSWKDNVPFYSWFAGKSAEEKRYDKWNAIVDAESELKPYIEGLTQAINEDTAAKRQEYTTKRWGVTGGSGGGRSGKGGGSNPTPEPTGPIAMQDFAVDFVTLDNSTIANIKKAMGEWQKEYENAATEGGRAYAQKWIQTLKDELTNLEGGNTPADIINADFAESMKKSQNAIKDLDKLSPPKDVADNWQAAANAVSQFGSALASIEDPSAKIAGIIAQAIANIALTFASSLKGTFTPWDWIAGAASGAATMIATISAIKSATAGSYAEGGIIPGAYNGGKDSKWAYVSPGELVLNRAQQTNLAAQLTQGNGGGRSEVTINGEQMKLIINNHLRSIGVSGDKLIGA